MDAFIYLFAAYSIVWIALFGYLFGLSRKQRKLTRDVETLKKYLETKGIDEE